MQITILIVSYNSCKLIVNQINSFKKFVKSNNTKFDFLVFENAGFNSDWNKYDNFLKKFNINLILSDENHGYGGAFNQVINKVKSDFVVLCNADLIYDCNPFDSLLNTFKVYNNIGCVGITQKYLNNKRQKSFRKILNLKNLLLELFTFDLISFGNSFSENTNSIFLNDCYVDGAFMFFQTEFIKKIGAFDSNFIFYFEDMDICNKIQNLGYKLIIKTDVSIIHLRGSDSIKESLDLSDFSIINYYNSLKYYILKNHSIPSLFFIKFIVIILSFQKVIIGSLLFFILGIRKYKKMISIYIIFIKKIYDFIL